MKRTTRILVAVGGLTLAVSATMPASAQTGGPSRVEVAPAQLFLSVGDTVGLTARAVDEMGNVWDVPLTFRSSARSRLEVSRSEGWVVAHKGGEYRVSVRVLTDRNVRAEIPVTVAYPPVTEVVVTPHPDRLFVGATLRHAGAVYDAAEDLRQDVSVHWSTDDPAVASVDRLGVLSAHREGTVTLTATAAGVTATHRYRVVANPIRTLTLAASEDSARTGDVVHFEATALDGAGRRIGDAPITYTLVAYPEDTVVAQFPTAEVDQQGRFVAQKAGVFTVMAIAPGRVAQRSVRIVNRHVSQPVKFVGQGAVREVRTSDLWIWEGVDGRDYGVTGTWSANGAAFFWDVTDPATPVLIDSIVVDARTVNDVKVSENGRIAVISREGASNRKNGIVILDVTNPRNVQTISTYDDGLTGGVHNVFIYQNHVYAVNNSRRFDVINIDDPAHPRRVGRFELDTPGHGIHDIWIVDGIAYTSNWTDGVVLIDVGNGIVGGSPSNPVEINRFRDVGGHTHAAFPYHSPSGKFYVFMGDEISRPGFDGLDPTRAPELMAGYVHIIDFTDPLNPEEVARYEVPEAGSHNLWIEDDVMYVAFYNGGLRIVDISGELKGNLYYQNREIARYMAYDPDGFVANGAFTWGPQPHKGNLFFAEHYSGLWAVKLMPRPQALTP